MVAGRGATRSSRNAPLTVALVHGPVGPVGRDWLTMATPLDAIPHLLREARPGSGRSMKLCIGLVTQASRKAM